MGRNKSYDDPEYRERMSAIVRARYAADPELRERIAANARATWADPQVRARRVASITAGQSDPEYRARKSAAARDHHADPDYRARMSAMKRGNTHARDAAVIGECAYCGRPAQTLDHVVPVTRGGADEPSNTVPACYGCNSSKYDRTPDEWLADGLLGSGARKAWRKGGAYRPIP